MYQSNLYPENNGNESINTPQNPQPLPERPTIEVSTDELLKKGDDLGDIKKK